PLYSRYRGVPAESSTTFARCGRLYTTLPFSIVFTRFGTDAFHCERRACVFARERRRLGTAMGVSTFVFGAEPEVYSVSDVSGRKPSSAAHRGSVPSRFCGTAPSGSFSPVAGSRPG